MSVTIPRELYKSNLNNTKTFTVSPTDERQLEYLTHISLKNPTQNLIETPIVTGEATVLYRTIGERIIKKVPPNEKQSINIAPGRVVKLSIHPFWIRPVNETHIPPWNRSRYRRFSVIYIDSENKTHWSIFSIMNYKIIGHDTKEALINLLRNDLGIPLSYIWNYKWL